MGWKERSKCRQLLKCTSVFSLRPRSAKGVRRELAGNLCSWGSQGLRGKPATPVHPQPGIRAAPGTRHLRGAGAGTGLGRTPGLWGAGDHHSRSLTLSLLSYPGQWKPPRSSPFPTPGGCSLGYLWSPVSPRRCSSTGLGRCHLLGCLWGVSPNTAAVPRACDTAQKCLFQHGRGDERQLSRPPSLLGAWVPACPSKGQSRQLTQGQEVLKCLPSPFHPLPFWGPQGQVLLLCPVFSHHHLSGVCSGPQSWPLFWKKTQACPRTSRCSSPQDTGASQLSPAHRARATHKRAFLKGTELRNRPNLWSRKIIYCFQW